MQDVNLRGTVGRLAACAAVLAITGLTTSAMAQTGGSGGMTIRLSKKTLTGGVSAMNALFNGDSRAAQIAW